MQHMQHQQQQFVLRRPAHHAAHGRAIDDLDDRFPAFVYFGGVDPLNVPRWTLSPAQAKVFSAMEAAKETLPGKLADYGTFVPLSHT